jgi:hypothetical protein
MRTSFVVAALALAGSANAAAPEQYRLHTASALARVCGATARDSDHATSLAFCHGFLAGSYAYFSASTPAADRFVCPPTPPVTRAQVGNGFVAWLKTKPQFNNDAAVDALFRYAAEAYPCKR